MAILTDERRDELESSGYHFGRSAERYRWHGWSDAEFAAFRTGWIEGYAYLTVGQHDSWETALAAAESAIDA